MVDPTNPFVQANTLDNSAVKPGGFGDTTKFSTRTSNPSPPPPPIPTDPKGFQQYLNDHGANPPLKVDGIVGPKTLAAAQTLNINVPPNLAPPAPAAPAAAAPPAPAPAPAAAAAAPAVADATVAPLPTLTADQIRAQYGYLGSLLDSPDIAALIAEKAADPSMDDATFLAKLYATPTWQTTSTSARNFIGLQSTDPAGLQDQINKQRSNIQNQAQTQGITIDPGRLDQMATDAVKLGWTTQQMQNAVAAEFHYKPGGQSGNVGAGETDIRGLAQQYGVDKLLDDSTLASWDQQIAAGTANAETFRQNIVQMAQSLYPGLAGQITAKTTTADALAPWKNTIAQELSVAPDTINFSDPKYNRFVNQIDITTGKPTPMSLYDTQRTIRSDPTYGWQYSQQGINSSFQFAHQFLGAIGAVPA